MAVLSDDPLGYWRLGEDAGPTATDATGTQDATYLGAVELGHPGLVAGSDTSVYFPGSGMAYIRVGDTAGFAGRVPFSVEAWVLPDSDDAGCIMGKSTFTTTHEGWFAASHMSTVRFQRMNDGYFSAGHPEVGKVFHLVVTYDGSTEKMFIDGDLVGSRIHEVDVPANTDFLLIGDCANWGNFAGFIDEVAVYDHALTPDQISAHFNAGK
jgi:hypothetical protein